MATTTREKFIEMRVAAARARCLGTRARLAFNADAEAARAGAAWDEMNTPESLALQATITAMTARGGKLWTDGAQQMRMYFNGVPVGGVGRTFDCYVDLRSGELCGALTDEERAVAQAAIWSQA